MPKASAPEATAATKTTRMISPVSMFSKREAPSGALVDEHRGLAVLPPLPGRNGRLAAPARRDPEDDDPSGGNRGARERLGDAIEHLRRIGFYPPRGAILAEYLERRIEENQCDPGPFRAGQVGDAQRVAADDFRPRLESEAPDVL